MQKIDLSGEWCCSYVENGMILNETFKIKHSDNKLIADVDLFFKGKNFKYIFEGTIKDDIINGNYEIMDLNYKENGVYSLKIVNKDILSGINTYISLNGDISQTKCTLTRKTENKAGTFNLCEGCINKKAKCCSNLNVDEPVLLPNEAKNISKNFNIPINEFATKINLKKIYNDKSLKDIYQMKRNKENTCNFYINNKCQIYDYRPVDCRIFP